MRKAPRTGPGPLCRAAARVGKFGGIRRKASPRGLGSKCCLPGGRIRPQLALAVSMELAPGPLLRLAQGRCCPVEWDGRVWGRCGKGAGGDTKGFPRSWGRLGAGGRQLKELEGRKRRRNWGRTPYLPGAVSAGSWTLTGAVPKPEDIRVSKASRSELGSRCPSQWEEPQEQFWGASWQHEQPAAKTKRPVQ